MSYYPINDSNKLEQRACSISGGLDWNSSSIYEDLLQTVTEISAVKLVWALRQHKHKAESGWMVA